MVPGNGRTSSNWSEVKQWKREAPEQLREVFAKQGDALTPATMQREQEFFAEIRG